jgi:hypothetical protein
MRKRNESERVQTNQEMCSKYARYYFVYIVGIYGRLLRYKFKLTKLFTGHAKQNYFYLASA